jgi:hypothetical protein
MPTELEEVPLLRKAATYDADCWQLIEFLHHGNTQIRQAGKATRI